jgi:hypothetical protein
MDNNKALPGFTAEVSLCAAGAQYRSSLRSTDSLQLAVRLQGTCSIPSSQYSCDLGGAWVYGTDLGCSVTCVAGYTPSCHSWTCDGTKWTQSICYCLPS